MLECRARTYGSGRRLGVLVLEIIVFVCGAALMGLEFLAARMLAPTLGSSLFVWGAVVSIVMVALSLGYWLGGLLADRRGSTRTLAPVIAGAGVFSALVPYLVAAVGPAVQGLGARTGSLVASAAVFFAPSLLLAMVSPLGVRLATGSRIDHVGRSAGQLYAISTAGSIAGTIATAFWLIPVMSLDGLLTAIALALLATGGLALALPGRYAEPEIRPAEAGEPTMAAAKRRPSWRIATVAILSAGLVLSAINLIVLAYADDSFTAAGERIIYRKDTQYHRLMVAENGDERILHFDRSLQSSMYLDDPFDTSFRYPNYLHTAIAVQPEAKRALVIGLGGGSVVKRMWRDYPQMTIDAVEIDPVVVDVAKRYFKVPSDPRIRLIAEDGRRYLNSTDADYDLIIVDAYYADSMPSHLTTVEFFRLAKEHLNPGGVLAYNVIGSVEGEDSRLFRSMYRTVGRVWDNVWAFPIGYGADHTREQRRNIIVLASDTRMSPSALRAAIRGRVGGRVTVPSFERFASDLLAERPTLGDVPVLTDQHAPTDSLIKVQ